MQVIGGAGRREEPETVRGCKARLADADTRYTLDAKGSKLPPAILPMTEKQFLKVDYRANLADLASMAKRMHAAGWTKRDVSGDIDASADLRILEKVTGKSTADLTIR